MLHQLEDILPQCWSIDTCYPTSINNWNESNISLGQCAITAVIVNDYLGGNIRKCCVDGISHYFNLIDGEIVDLTKGQFINNEEINYADYSESSKEKILSNNDTLKRYNILKKKVSKYIWQSYGIAVI